MGGEREGKEGEIVKEHRGGERVEGMGEERRRREWWREGRRGDRKSTRLNSSHL